MGLPRGTVTFLFTDIEGSTRLWDEHPDAMGDAVVLHNDIIRHAIDQAGGMVVKSTGDGFHAVFRSARAGLDAAIAAQLGLTRARWPATGPLRVRMGLHTGEAELREGDYYGPAVNRAARIASAAHGGQILVSLATVELVRDDLPPGVSLTDLGEHRLRDLARPEHLFQVVHPDLEREFAPLRSLDAYATNLPLALSSFVGRQAESRAVVEALRGARVVTITGAAGVGKTRLALHVAADVLPHYRDGVWIVELGPLADADGLPALVANTLLVRPRPGVSARDNLIAALAARQLLLVLDNCEHLRGPVASLVQAIVRQAPGVTVLATSRVSLGVPGERVVPIGPLPVPDAITSTAEALTSPSVRLFLDRAVDAKPGYEAGADDIQAAAHITRRLEGIPLALELAAARVRMMTPVELAARLEDRFALLTSGPEGSVERHQTLRRAIDWSYDLLDPTERALLRRLSVFVGGFTLDAAETVTTGTPLARTDVLHVLAQLIDKSLVIVDEPPPGGTTRYRLLETIRQYACERLEESGETADLERRHANWAASFVEHAARELRGPDEASWLSRTEREIDNLRVAIHRCCAAGDALTATALLGPFSWWSLFARRLGYVLAPLAGAVLALHDVDRSPRYPSVLAVRALDHLDHDLVDAAEHDATTAIDALLGDGFAPTIGPWAALFMTEIQRGRPDRFLHRADELRTYARAHGDAVDVVLAEYIVSSCLITLGRAIEARPILESAAQQAATIGNPTLLTLTGFGLGLVWSSDDPERAIDEFERSIRIGVTVGLDFFAGIALGQIGALWPIIDDARVARRLSDALELAQVAGDRSRVDLLLGSIVTSLATSGHTETAAILTGYLATEVAGRELPIAAQNRQASVAALVAALGADRYAELEAAGRALSTDEAVALTREALGPPGQ